MSSPAARDRSAVVAVVALAAFAVLTAVLAVDASAFGDRGALRWLTDRLGTSSDDGMVWIGRLTQSLVLVPVALAVTAWLLARRRWADALLFAGCVAVGFAVNPLLKEVFDRPRPSVRPLPEDVSTWSYPSGHSSNTAVMLGAALLVAHRHRVLVGVLGGAAVALVGFSRMATGVHYPTDVLGGWLWITAWVAYLAHGVSRRRRTPRASRRG